MIVFTEDPVILIQLGEEATSDYHSFIFQVMW